MVTACKSWLSPFTVWVFLNHVGPPVELRWSIRCGSKCLYLLTHPPTNLDSCSTSRPWVYNPPVPRVASIRGHYIKTGLFVRPSFDLFVLKESDSLSENVLIGWWLFELLVLSWWRSIVGGRIPLEVDLRVRKLPLFSLLSRLHAMSADVVQWLPALPPEPLWMPPLELQAKTYFLLQVPQEK